MFTVKEVAQRLNVSAGFVYKLVKSGKLGAHLIGRSVRISDEQIKTYLSNSVAPLPPEPRMVNVSELITKHLDS